MNKSAKLIVAAGESSADMRYATAFPAPDPYIFFEIEGKRGAILSQLEFDRAREVAHKDITLYPAQDFGSGIFAEVLGMTKRFGVEKLLVPSDFPLLLADKLRDNSLVVEAVDGKFFPQREFKTRWELELITKALRVAENALQEACKVIANAKVDSQNRLVADGELLTSERLRRLIDLYIAGENGQPTGTIVAGGLQGAEPHNGGSGVLYAHSPIVMDIFPRMLDSGYWGDLTRTVSKGRPADVVCKAYSAVKSARDEARGMLRSGVIPADVYNQANKILEEAGFSTGVDGAGRSFGFFHSLGHGVGLEIHEEPRLSPKNAEPLQGGEVITVEPGLYYPEWGGIRLEDMVYITKDGAELLTQLESELVID